MSTIRLKPTPPPRPNRPDANQTPLTPTSPLIPGGWLASSHSFPLPHPPHPKSPPPSPPVSAGLSGGFSFSMARLALGSGAVRAPTKGGDGDPPNTPVTPAAWLSGVKRKVATNQQKQQQQQQQKKKKHLRSRSKRFSVSSSDNSVESSPQVDRSSRPRALTQPTKTHASDYHNAQQPSLLPHLRERRRGSATSPRHPHITETRGWSSSSDSDDAEDNASAKQRNDRPHQMFRAPSGSSDTAPATVLQLEGVGAVVIEEAPRRAITAKAGGGVRLVDARRPSNWSIPTIFKDGEVNVGEAEAAEVQEEAKLTEPGPGLSGNERVRKTLKSKGMEALQTGRLSPGGVLDFSEKPLPSTPMSMQPTPRELYHSSDGSASTSSSPLPSPACTPPPATCLPLRFPMPPSHIPGRKPVQPLSEPYITIDGNIDNDMIASAYPLTPIATDLGSLSVIAGLEEDGSVVTVIPPEQSAWQRTAYVADPIQLNNLANNSAGAFSGLPNIRGKAGSVASLDAFQDAVESLLDNPATQGRRASDESVVEELVTFFEDFGFGPAAGEKDSLDCFWSSDLNNEARELEADFEFAEQGEQE
ncbi:ABC transporter [Lasiodiplodia theobromae]|uniref:ABC transporter n=1 Tax=Lasiodiplodia theobromae TaxID=45133 RepID=UPI0015C3A33B|nr:ABC transporter [Lasiodiplodia theobromae]KAF4536549.1 ABC transporter [Lasiodiplodia theobromae]